MVKKAAILTGLGLAGLASLVTLGIVTETALAYTAYPSSTQLGYGVFVKSNGTYQIDGGDQVLMDAPGYSGLNGQQTNIMKTYGVVDSDSQGEWEFAQADVLGQDANNGYLLVGNTEAGSNNVSDWITRLGGNPTYVNEYLTENGWSDITGQDRTNFNTFHFASFAAIVTACGASVTENEVTATGETDADGNPVYQSVRHIQTTNPPTADSIRGCPKSIRFE
ncbi:hypothetical protein NZD89_28035 (plasmid) [Alicyclobacillus fastidiosus]|uniref:Uncharacterized protein n=1 Tax=Alicyclobacillus fastidiosus TaxID=392011 RepID=A0ABY6ZSG8_9BACL|nr:hypothetical protein [Alicyclobacillus fastidiosus]WAH44900.1 hypothetical protein NZD89_28035 [Alicyclobacillus fastidiosus]GMA65659.1 hypothetical protein GCM10025859_60990 [Alicyclobacillus fastidiosus]